jgi:hypothetical protein
MPLPDHIRKQVEAGQAAFAAQQKGEPIPGMDDEGGPPEIASQPGLEAPPAAAAEMYDQSDIHEPDPPQGDPPGDPAPIGDPPPDDADPVAKAKHAIATWKGRAQAARAEQVKMMAKIDELTDITNQQFAAIAKLQAQQAEGGGPPAGAASPSGLPAASEAPDFQAPTTQERQQYGEEFSDYIERLAIQAVAKQLADMRAKVSSITGAVENVDKRTRKQLVDDFYRDLGARVPDYNEIDKDPEWVLWLNQQDAYTGDTRKNLFVKACEMADSARAAQFFLGFRAEQDATDPTRTPSTPGNGNASGVPVLERMASPGRPRQPASREAPAPEKITDGQVRSFYTDVSKGKYRNRPKEKADMVARIEAALLRGDVVTLQ